MASLLSAQMPHLTQEEQDRLRLDFLKTSFDPAGRPLTGEAEVMTMEGAIWWNALKATGSFPHEMSDLQQMWRMQDRPQDLLSRWHEWAQEERSHEREHPPQTAETDRKTPEAGSEPPSPEKPLGRRNPASRIRKRRKREPVWKICASIFPQVKTKNAGVRAESRGRARQPGNGARFFPRVIKNSHLSGVKYASVSA